MGKITKGARPFGWLADIAGKKIANAIGQIWSAAMMLEHLGHPNAAEAIETVLAAGAHAGYRRKREYRPGRASDR